jgi:hypothetical protein
MFSDIDYFTSFSLLTRGPVYNEHVYPFCSFVLSLSHKRGGTSHSLGNATAMSSRSINIPLGRIGSLGRILLFLVEKIDDLNSTSSFYK